MTLPPDLELRTALPEDEPALAALVAACDVTYLEWAPPDWEPPPPERAIERWHGRLTDGSRWTRIAVEPSGRVVGLVCFAQAVVSHEDSTPVAGRAHVSAVFTHPDRWREGIAAGLLGLAEDAMRAQGYRECQLWTPTDAPARGFYEAHGWRHDGRTLYAPEIGLGLVAYVKPL